MKKVKSLFGLVCLLVLALSSICLTSCSSDDDKDSGKTGTLTINGKGEAIRYAQGSYDPNQRRIHISFAYGEDINNQYQFGWYADGDPDYPEEMGVSLSQVVSTTPGFNIFDGEKNYDVESGSLSIGPTDKAKGKLTVDFDNLKITNGTTFNGTIVIDYTFESSEK